MCYLSLSCSSTPDVKDIDMLHAKNYADLNVAQLKMACGQKQEER